MFRKEFDFAVVIDQGLNGDDLDTVFVLWEQESTDAKTSFDLALLRLRYDPLELNNYVIDLLVSYIHEDEGIDIAACRKIQALFPIISIVFNDQTRVEIFVQIKYRSLTQQVSLMGNNPIANFHEPLHGVRELSLLNLPMDFLLSGARCRTPHRSRSFSIYFPASVDIHSRLGSESGSLRSSVRLPGWLLVGDSMCIHLSHRCALDR